ncbi:hypothetical protein HYW53_00040 [Candidatus Giovannonibacteria bacterium]|nr:hypothetical protein [Candidatus Giovannonibacteria bacterium]
MDEKETKEIRESPINLSVLVSAIIVASALVYNAQFPNAKQTVNNESAGVVADRVLPVEGILLPVILGDLGSKMASVGVIDADELKKIYGANFSSEYQELLFGNSKSKLRITEQNSGFLLNIFWALGLGQKSTVLDAGEMNDPKYGGAGIFASTGGWTIAKGSAMDHYSRHLFFNLTPEQNALVEKVSKNIYRPCCNNSTHFPDCNHGMAMLGFLELMASQGVGEREMYKAALAVNTYWFPDNYLTIASYKKSQGVEWKDVSPEEILGFDYSSASGYSKVVSKTKPIQRSQGGSCGIEG